MQRYSSGNNTNTNHTNMSTYDHDSAYYGSCQDAFGMDAHAGESHHDVAGRNITTSLNIGSFMGNLDRLDPSASFPGLGELPSSGLESAVENNLAGTFTGDLNSTVYEVHGEDQSQLLQEMLQQQSAQSHSAQSEVNSQVCNMTLHKFTHDRSLLTQEHRLRGYENSSRCFVLSF